MTDRPVAGPQAGSVVPPTNAFGQGIAYVLPAHVVRIVLLLGGWAVAARFLSPADFGTFVLLLVAVEVLTLVSDVGMTSTVVRFLSAGTIDARRVTGVAAGFVLTTSAAVASVVFLWGEAGLNLVQASRSTEVAASIAVLFVCQYCQAALSAFLQGLHRYRRVAVVQLVEACLRFALVIVCVAYLGMGIDGLILAAASASVAAALTAYWFMPWRIVPRLDLPVLKEMLGFGVPLQVQGVMGLAFERTDVLMLGAVAGVSSVAAYDVAYKGPNQIRGLFAAFRSVFLPHISGHYGAGRTVEAERFLKSTLRATSCVLAGATLVTALYGRELVSLVFSPTYADSGPISALLMAGVSVGLCNYLIGTALIAAGRPKVVLRAAAPEAIINVAANVLLIPAFGVVGAASASIISRTAVNPVFLLQLARTEIWPTATSYLRSFANFGVAYAASFPLAPLGHWGRAFSLGLYVVLSLKFSGLTRADLNLTNAGPSGVVGAASR